MICDRANAIYRSLARRRNGSRLMLPRKTKRPKMGVREPERRVYQTHRAFVRHHECAVPGCKSVDNEFAHLRTAANSGVGQKPSDAFGVSLCPHHHREQHSLGMDSFQAKYNIDLWRLAEWFSGHTTDRALREALREVR